MPAAPEITAPTPYEELLGYFPEAAELEEKPAADPAPDTVAAAEDTIDPVDATDPVDETETSPPEPTLEALQAQLAEAATELAALRARPPAPAATPAPAPQLPTPEDPLGHIESESALAEEVARAQRITAFALANFDGVGPDGEPTHTLDAQGERVELSAAQVRGMYATYRAVLDQAPAKFAALRHTQSFSAEADRVYPELAAPDTEEFRLTQQVLQALPGIKKFPDWKLFVGDWLRGQKARLATAPETAPNKPTVSVPKSKAAPELAPKAPVAKAAAPRVQTPQLAAKAKAQERILETAGSREAIAAYFEIAPTGA